ncbi:MAG TPA: pantoate--beta-alanine ligase [Chitinophagaceae bacterium]|nr:pantoate--beta-alanine ligase [Chitinophagaceae bacterium]
MLIFKKRNDLKTYLKEQKSNGKKIGFVPTMGALHEGHIFLVQSSRKENDITVVSIFVNPTQFNDPEDFKKYPVTIESDIYKLELNQCEVLFLPSVEEIYPEGEDNMEHFELGYLETVLEGKFRPGHFQGVCKVMKRLLNIVEPHNLYMGQKDYQQCMVVKKLIELLNLSLRLHICPTFREPGGLAMSSRNLRLSPGQKESALAIYKMLVFVKKGYKDKNFNELKEIAGNLLYQAGFNAIDYIEIVNADNLELLEKWDKKTPLVAVVAAFMGDVRLIDNMILTNG